MPRNSSGIYSLPAGNPVISGTEIESVWANTTMNDLGAEITNSLPRNGSAPMTGMLTLLAAPPTTTQHATNKAYVDSSIGAIDTAKVDKTSDIGSAVLPKGTTAERDGTPVAGYIRYNTTLSQFEGYGIAWGAIGGGGGATGGGTDKVFVNNDQVVTANYSIPVGQNSMTAGPVTINDGVTITVPDGSTWSIV